MSGVTGDIKKLFNFKYKTRNDSITDQYNRVYMVKAMMVAAFLTGMKWYKDITTCVIPGKMDSSTLQKYGPEACWINGFYVYKELRDRQNYMGYYGLPDEAAQNGTDIFTGLPCVADHTNPNCQPMTKMFFLQYQWFPFYVAALGFLYYLPYILFRYVNNDLITLKESIKSQKPNIDDIVNNYFSNVVNTPNQQNMRVLANILVKFSYLMANVLTFVFTNSLLNGEFNSFGSEWMNWSKKTNEEAHNYIGMRHLIKPGEKLLPTFAFCDILERGQDIKHQLVNEVTSLCELSQHVLYHYVLLALWFLIIIGILVSIVGMIELFISYLLRKSMFGKEEVAAQRVFGTLTSRQGEYLDFIKKKNVPIYGELIRKLYADKFGSSSSSEVDGSSKEAENTAF
ncbi:innexin inx3-like [Hydractinia symbiolongicarpus]|uniref:innexin inx3-like n=1 Tax=Hydractinia symbiolongicarpus TaxID=13093 RepID=UPI00254FCF1E|nr:innexin inx3-like [Hydractinia symbiolongicarpus]